MNKKLMKQLVLVSYKNGELDSKTVSQIAEKLDRKSLKQYIKLLKSAEKLRNVYIETPFGLQKDILADFKGMFPDKKIIIKKNSDLLVGAKITNNDDIFEMSLKNSLDTIVDDLENYD